MMCVHPHIMADKDILEIVRSSKNIMDADSEDKNERNDAVLVPISSEMSNFMKSMHSYLDTHSNGEINNKMGNIEQCVGNANAMLNKQWKEKYQIFFP
ncbi:hypothetical protein TNCV_2479151 [Trichonephila clavipes]|nr:hypothetical protein TNCV_2479151 [Trichonephila clavipes]